MSIVGCHKVEDCFDGSAVLNYELSEPWTAANIRSLESLGELQYFADFPRPLFRLRSQAGLFVSGVEGASTCRVILPRTNREIIQQEFEKTLDKD